MTDVPVPVSILLLISGFSLVAFVVFMVIHFRLCENESPSDLPFHAPLGLSHNVHRGLSSNVIESFPTFTYSAGKGLKIERGSLECAVCLSEFQDDDKLRLLPQCNHAFHLECIDEWLSSHVTCPICRANLIEDSGTADAEAVLVDIPGEVNDPRSDRQEDAGRFGMLNHVAAGASDVEPNSNVVPSAGVALAVPAEEHFDEEQSETVDVVHAVALHQTLSPPA